MLILFFQQKCSVDSCKPEGQSTINVDKMTTEVKCPTCGCCNGAMGVHPETSVFHFSLLKKTTTISSVTDKCRKNLDDRRAESHGISHMNPGHLAPCKSHTLFCQRLRKKQIPRSLSHRSTQTLTRLWVSDAADKLPSATSSSRLWCSQHFLYSPSSAKAPARPSPTRPLTTLAISSCLVNT